MRIAPLKGGDEGFNHNKGSKGTVSLYLFSFDSISDLLPPPGRSRSKVGEEGGG